MLSLRAWPSVVGTTQIVSFVPTRNVSPLFFYPILRTSDTLFFLGLVLISTPQSFSSPGPFGIGKAFYSSFLWEVLIESEDISVFLFFLTESAQRTLMSPSGDLFLYLILGTNCISCI